MDELIINTLFGKKIIKKIIERTIRKKLNRNIQVTLSGINMAHHENGDIVLNFNLTASMSEAELIALIEQIGGDK